MFGYWTGNTSETLTLTPTLPHTETLSKVSISACKPDQGARGTRAISAILPVLLEKGVNSPVAGIQSVAMDTVMKICENTGDLLADHVTVLIPALIAASVNVEPKVLGQVNAHKTRK